MERWEEKENREFLRAGTIAAAALNPWRGEARRYNPYAPYDFFNIPKPPKRELSAKERLARRDAFFEAHNAKVARLEGRRKKKKA